MSMDLKQQTAPVTELLLKDKVALVTGGSLGIGRSIDEHPGTARLGRHHPAVGLSHPQRPAGNQHGHSPIRNRDQRSSDVAI